MTSESSITPRTSPGDCFATTQWTRVLEASGNSADAQAALSALCDAYYAPVFAFIRWHAPDEEAARDLTQEFFARLLAREGLGAVDPERGHFRSYLLGAVKHFLTNVHRDAHRLKRDSGHPLESIDAQSDTSPGLQVPDPTAPTPDREFDRKWALALLDRALATLAAEHQAAEKSDHFEILKPWLTGDEEISQAAAAQALGMNENAVKVAIHRLRRRFREVIKAEIAKTVNESAQVQEELQNLLQAL